MMMMMMMIIIMVINIIKYKAYIKCKKSFFSAKCIKNRRTDNKMTEF